MIGIGSYRNQIIAAATATIGAFGLGSVLGWTSMGMPSLNGTIIEGKLDMPLISKGTESWIGSVANLGALASAIVVGFLLDLIGRKWSMLILCPPFVLGWLLIAFAKNHAMIIVGRAITGFTGGGFSLAAPLFVAEMSDDSIRGALGAGFQVMVTFGILFSYCFGIFLNYKWLSIASAVVPVVFVAAMIFIPESPRYLVQKGKTAEANKALCWFRNKKSSQDVEEEMNTIEKGVNEMKAQSSSFGELFVRYHLVPSLLMLALMVFQQLSGINAVIFYTKQIFISAGSTMSDDLSTNIVGIVQVVATVCSIFLMDRAGRKLLLLISSGTMCVSLVLLGVYFQLKEDGKGGSIGWLPLVSLIIFITAFSIGYGPIPWLMMGELIPQKVKGRVASIATLLNWTLAFVVTKWFDQLQDAIGIQWCYWMFAIICAVGFVFVLLLLPETKGKSVEEIEKYFGVPQGQERRKESE